MHRHKSQRHANAAKARWRAADARAQAEHDDGIPDRPEFADPRQPITLDLRSAGGPLLMLEPRTGFVAWRAVDESGAAVHCAAMKELLHKIADDLPRWLSARNYQ